MLHVICFSHRRQLQLHGYLESLYHYLRVDQVSVVYPRQDYSIVSNSCPQVEFVEECPDFNQTLRRVISAIRQPFVMFGCDDMVFTRLVDVPAVVDVLDRQPSVLGYSTRLHDKLPDAPLSTLWEWPKYSLFDGYWGYPFDVSGTIYRTECVKNLSANLSHQKSPNTFESAGTRFMKKHLAGHYPLLFRSGLSSCIVQQVNNVQTTVPIVQEHFRKEHSPEAMDRLYKSGKRMDWKHAKGAIGKHVWTNDFWRVR